MKLQFSGHESFVCKNFWLKKGYDFIRKNENFNDESAVISLGVGKNMVISISYWLKAFVVTDNSNKLTEFGHFIFDDRKGVDPFIEDLGTVWLLHYFLVKTSKASLYSLFFNEFRKGRVDFTKDQLLNFIKRKMEELGQAKFNKNTVDADINAFLRSYLKPNFKETKIDIEEDFSSLLIDLGLLEHYTAENADGKKVDWYKIENSIQSDLPYPIVLFSILDNDRFGNSISFKDLMVEINSPGSLFALNEEGLYKKIEMMTSKHKNIVFTETAGVRELQFKKRPNKSEVLNEYYKT
jgi:hypothetical protein